MAIEIARQLKLDYPRRFRITGRATSRTGAAVDFTVSPVGEGSHVVLEAELSGLAIRPFEGAVKPWLEIRVERTVAALRERLDPHAP